VVNATILPQMRKQPVYIDHRAMNKKRNKQTLGLISRDGFFQPVSTLNVAGLEYASKSKAELREILEEKVKNEQYEDCALIRDELIKRS